MPLSNCQTDHVRQLRLRAVAGLVVAPSFLLLAVATAVADSPQAIQLASYDPFDQSPAPAAATTSATEAKSAKSPAPVRCVVRDADGRETAAFPFDDNAQHKENGKGTLVSGEQLPGIPPAPARALTPAPAPVEQAGTGNWSPKPLGDLSVSIRLPNGMLPRDYWAEHPQPLPMSDTCGANRGWPMDCYHWCPTCLCYQPLYFEDPNLERYGYGCSCCTCCGSTCLQSACSAAHFFGTVPALPYMMAANCPCECNYALGDYRPGDCVPWRYQCCAPCSAAGSFAEGSAAYGLILMLP